MLPKRHRIHRIIMKFNYILTEYYYQTQKRQDLGITKWRKK